MRPPDAGSPPVLARPKYSEQFSSSPTAAAMDAAPRAAASPYRLCAHHTRPARMAVHPIFIPAGGVSFDQVDRDVRRQSDLLRAHAG